MSKRKDWAINQALKEYLHRRDREWLRAEARRQSILASKQTQMEGRGSLGGTDGRVWNDN